MNLVCRQLFYFCFYKINFKFSVIAIDNDPQKIEIARHNAELYGVADRIQFIIGDYFALAPTLKADVVFLSPPWGGPDLMNLEEYKLSYLMPENGGIEQILSLARNITLNVALHLPKNTNIFDVKYRFVLKRTLNLIRTSFLFIFVGRIGFTIFVICYR